MPAPAVRRRAEAAACCGGRVGVADAGPEAGGWVGDPAPVGAGPEDVGLGHVGAAAGGVGDAAGGDQDGGAGEAGPRGRFGARDGGGPAGAALADDQVAVVAVLFFHASTVGRWPRSAGCRPPRTTRKWSGAGWLCASLGARDRRRRPGTACARGVLPCALSCDVGGAGGWRRGRRGYGRTGSARPEARGTESHATEPADVHDRVHHPTPSEGDTTP